MKASYADSLGEYVYNGEVSALGQIDPVAGEPIEVDALRCCLAAEDETLSKEEQEMLMRACPLSIRDYIDGVLA